MTHPVEEKTAAMTLTPEVLERVEAAATYELMVCRWEGSVGCVYLNDFRVAGGKPWGGAEAAATWQITRNDIERAIPEIATERAALVAEIKALRASLGEIKHELLIPAAEYVPAIPAVWDIIDKALGEPGQ
jgi:hypothetical protein